MLLDNLERIGHVTPEAVLPPLTDAAWGYRRKGRFSVRRVEKKDKTLVGFREQRSALRRRPRRLRDGDPADRRARSTRWRALVDGMEARREIPQIEFIAGDPHADYSGIALVFRHLQPLSERDRDALVAFAQAHDFAIFLQPGGIDSVHPLWPDEPEAGVPRCRSGTSNCSSGRSTSSRSTPASTRR